MTVGVAATEPTTAGDARMGMISSHGADIGFGSHIRISFIPPARRTMALGSATQSTLTTPVVALPVPQSKQLARQGAQA